MANNKNKTHKQYWLKNDIDKKLNDYSKLIGSTKTKLLVKIINDYFERKIVNKEFIVPYRPLYVNMNTLLHEGTVKASTKAPSRNFEEFYTVKKISNNLDSFSKRYKTFCYNDNPSAHKGIFIFYIFSKEAVPVPLVMDYYSTSPYEQELELSLIKLSDLPLLIESEEDVKTIEGIINSVKENVEKYNYLNTKKDLDFIENEEDKFHIGFMASISDVIEDFSGRKKIDLLINFRLNEFETPLADSISKDLESNYYAALDSNITTEDIFNRTIEQDSKINELSSELENLKEYKQEIIEAVENIREWWEMEEEEKEERKTEIWNRIKEEQKKKD